MTIQEFLLARLAEDEEEALANSVDWAVDDAHDVYERDRLHDRQPHRSKCGWRLGEGLSQVCTCGYPARVLAEVAAHRAILAAMEESDADGSVYFERGVGLDLALRHLAAVYADHSHYDPAWRP